jgi:RNA recognition motif-containing protein
MASSKMPLKRKREDAAPVADELEIDLSLPEPLSKKAARKAKRPKKAAEPVKGVPAAVVDDDADPTPKREDDEEDKKPPGRSAFAIWIGNLPWTATKPALRSFLREQAGVPDDAITRLHMPAPAAAAPSPSPSARGGGERPVNRGFAYVDFATAAHQRAALAASERALGGRRVLIKDARSFEGRPAPAAPSAADGGAGVGGAVAGSRDKPPSKRVFVGNLAFDVTKDDLERHFSQCGELADVFLATFEDSGKCKGFGWVTFAEVGGAVAAVRGWILREQDEEERREGKEGKKLKPRKWTVNKLAGRVLRCEFAEDPALRYRKRFGKKKEGAPVEEEDAAAGGAPLPPAIKGEPAEGGARSESAARKKQTSAHERRRAKRKTEQLAQT